MTTPRCKADFYAGQATHAFGNHLRVEVSLDALAADGYSGPVGVRYTEPGSPWCAYGLTPDAARLHVAYAVSQGADATRFRYGEMAPDARLRLQGELQRTRWGLDLLWSPEPLPMRHALVCDPRHAEGLTALALLTTHCNPASLAMLDDLLDACDGAVVEFGAYACHLGCLPHHNTVIWEVRGY